MKAITNLTVIHYSTRRSKYRGSWMTHRAVKGGLQRFYYYCSLWKSKGPWLGTSSGGGRCSKENICRVVETAVVWVLGHAELHSMGVIVLITLVENCSTCVLNGDLARGAGMLTLRVEAHLAEFFTKDRPKSGVVYLSVCWEATCAPDSSGSASPGGPREDTVPESSEELCVGETEETTLALTKNKGTAYRIRKSPLLCDLLSCWRPWAIHFFFTFGFNLTNDLFSQRRILDVFEVHGLIGSSSWDHCQ